jgi:hypothetical protein
MANQAPSDVSDYYGWMTGMLGKNTAPMSRALLNPAGLNSNEILRELWASWEGDNFMMSEFFLRALTTRGDYIRNLLPIEQYDVAIRKYGLRAKGDQVTFDVWNFESAVLPDQSRRHPGRRAEDEREQHSRSFRGGGVGFEVPLDWLEHDTTKRHFAMKIEQMNRSIYLTWTYRVLQTLMYEGLDIYSRRLQHILPLTHENFAIRIDQLVANTFAMNKNGTNFSGIETRVVNQGQTRDVHYDTVLVPPNSVRAMLVERAPMNLYYLRGDEVQDKNKQAKDLRPEGNVTKHYGLNVFESREFPMGNGAAARDPLANECTVSQRFIMTPTHVVNGFRDYRSCFRDIEVPDGDNRVWTRITLRAALLHSGMFAPRANTGDYYLTPEGSQILRELCESSTVRHETGNAPPQHTKGPGIGHHNSSSGVGAHHHFPSANGPLEPERHGSTMPERANALNLYRNAGIAREIISYLGSMPSTDYSAFVKALNTSAKDFRSTAADVDFDAAGDTWASRYTRDNNRFGGDDDEIEKYIAPTVHTAHPGDTLTLGGGGGLARFRPQLSGGVDVGGVSDAQYDMPFEAFYPKVVILASFLLQNQADHPDKVQLVQRTANKCFVNDQDPISKLLLPILQDEAVTGRPIMIPYSSNRVPLTLEHLGHDPYWQKLNHLAQPSRLNNSLVQKWIDAAVRYIEHKDRGTRVALAADTNLHALSAPAITSGVSNLEHYAVTSWKLAQEMYNATTQQFWAAMTLIGRGARPAAFNTTTPMMTSELPTAKTIMSQVNSLAVVAMDFNACPTSELRYVRAFVTHLLDVVRPEEIHDQFITTLGIAMGNTDPALKISTVVEFMKHSGQAALSSSERRLLTDVFTDAAGGSPSDRDPQRARMMEQTPDAIEAMLTSLRPNFAFWDALIRCDIPFPMSFILFRMNIRVEASSIIFMVAGPSTGVVVIKDGFLSFTRRQADFALDVGTRFRSATFITNRDHVELVPHAMSKRCLGGVGTRLWDPCTDTDRYMNGALIKDIFVMAVPYDWRQEAVWTDITGKMNPFTYNGSVRGLALGHTQFKTCEIYKAMWGFHHTRAHIFSAQSMGGMAHNPTLALQGTQKCHSGEAGAIQLTRYMDGHDPMGRCCEPIDYQILSGGSTAVSGTGMEDFTPRRDLLRSSRRT